MEQQLALARRVMWQSSQARLARKLQEQPATLVMFHLLVRLVVLPLDRQA